MNTNFCFDGHFLWKEFGENKKDLFKTPNIFCNILLSYYDKLKNLKDINLALETGTYEAHSAMCMSKLFSNVSTVELYAEQNPYNNKNLLELYKNIKKEYNNIDFYFGESPKFLKELISQNPDETFFILLDAHTFNYSPMIDELDAIKNNSNKNDHIIMIDDCNFLGYNGYPSYDILQKCILNINSDYKITNTFQGNGILLIHI